MKSLYSQKRTLIIYFSIVYSLMVFATCVNNENNQKEKEIKIAKPPIKNITYGQFTGSAICAKCHKNISEDYIHTAHYFTTRIATGQTIKGSFTPGKNSFAYGPERIVKLEKRDSGFYQVYYYKGEVRVVKRFDVVVG